MKTLCTRCGKAYDIDEWVRCPHCAMKVYRWRNPYIDGPKPTPEIYPWWNKDRVIWS